MPAPPCRPLLIKMCTSPTTSSPQSQQAPRGTPAHQWLSAAECPEPLAHCPLLLHRTLCGCGNKLLQLKGTAACWSRMHVLYSIKATHNTGTQLAYIAATLPLLLHTSATVVLCLVLHPLNTVSTCRWSNAVQRSCDATRARTHEVSGNGYTFAHSHTASNKHLCNPTRTQPPAVWSDPPPARSIHCCNNTKSTSFPHCWYTEGLRHTTQTHGLPAEDPTHGHADD